MMNPDMIKLLLAVSAAILVFLLSFGLVLSLGWPWWVGIFVLLGLVGCGIFLVFLRKIYAKRREQYFVSQIIEQDQSYMQSLKEDERRQEQELQKRWNEAIRALRRSHLRKLGNPLYVLPWYLVLGESGSGKTTSITSARLSSPFAEVNKVSGLSGTKNCDWWFFEQAVILDTAGRYAIPIDEGRDKQEWQNFLTLLAKYRKKEPLNGLVVSMAADKLFETNPEVLIEEGKGIRRRIDELMRVLGSKFPVYVLITKCDLIQGMTQFCERLTDKQLEQAMGSINFTSRTDVEGFSQGVLHTLTERLRNIRLLLLHKAGTTTVDPGLLLFPEEFSRLETGISAFIKGAFQENPYQESPLLRGIFFSSGRQEGSPYSHFLRTLGLIEETDVLPGTNKGLFLHDFFEKILPRERLLFAPTQRAIEWNRITKNLGLLSWVTLMVAICGLLSFSFVKNLSIIRSVPREAPIFQGDFVTDVSIQDRFRRTILTVEDANSNWWIPRFGLNESARVEKRLKNAFCKQSQEGFVTPLDTDLAEDLTGIDRLIPDNIAGDYIAHLVRRINLIKARLAGNTLEQLQKLPQPSYKVLISSPGRSPGAEIEAAFSDMYLYRLVWEQDSGILNKEMIALQEWLFHLLNTKITNLEWITAWVNETLPSSRISLKDFWGGSLEVHETTAVPPAFTLEGRKTIELFIKEMESALADPLIISRRKLEFNDWYKKSYLEAWYMFAENFSNGSERLKGKQEWDQVASRMASHTGPYISLLKRMDPEMEAYSNIEKTPEWIRLIYEIKMIQNKASSLDAGSVLTKVSTKGANIKQKIQNTLADTQAGSSVGKQLDAARAYKTYMMTLDEISSTLSSTRTNVYQMASKTFQEEFFPDSPFGIAQNAIKELKGATSIPAQEKLWGILDGPVDFLWSYTCRETGCYLQDVWGKKVLVEVSGISDYVDANNILLGKDGVSTRFMKGPAAPFIARDLKKGFYARKVLGRTIPLENDFLTYITRGEMPVRSTYTVTITGLPTDTNAKASTKPHATILELQCAQETLNLTNLNYPARKTFNWSPQTCGNVLFIIEVGDLSLIKEYKGSMAFPRFLHDFRTGQHSFSPDDFPNQKTALRRMGITYIKVRYRFSGHQNVIDVLIKGPGKAPEKISACWDQ
ncbi:MAG TPA: type VI secretion system protein ImpL [Deltaproteobacteria bacterium]|nr:type VI secretion system protein ImpL [Deltaproteobacteria bacterium]